MRSSRAGTVCINRDKSDTQMMTHRLTCKQWKQDVLAAFKSSQADYFVELEKFGHEDENHPGITAVQYMDYYGC